MARHTMRKTLRASDNALLRVADRIALLLSLVSLSLCGVACAKPLPAPRPRQPPPRVLLVGVEQVTLRTSAWVELHAWLAAAGRGKREIGDPVLDTSALAYGAALGEDERDELIARTTHALQACDEEKCARAAITGTPFATAYLDALPVFLGSHWMARATTARAGVEVARAAIGPEMEAYTTQLAKDLALEWPAAAPIVDVVTDSPEPGPEAPIRALLAARGSCFEAERGETTRMHDTRIVDCVLVYAALGMQERSKLGVGLDARSWTALVVHAVATVMTGVEPRHVSLLRRSAAAVMPEKLEWLAKEWPARLRGEAPADFAKRYVAVSSSP
jgi:hypothetical protein